MIAIYRNGRGAEIAKSALTIGVLKDDKGKTLSDLNGMFGGRLQIIDEATATKTMKRSSIMFACGIVSLMGAAILGPTVLVILGTIWGPDKAILALSISGIFFLFLVSLSAYFLIRSKRLWLK